ncbi:MAG: phenylalanine--tRNA ligase subunit alpha [Mycoplasmoidaceae bacterium]|nr:MAG: phenylalanine--tRNA ligase subunit alpha [Mycoplasmoidaceae bacterium]
MSIVDKETLLNDLDKLLKASENETKIIEIKNIFVKTKLNPLYGELAKLPNDQKGPFGKAINEVKIESAALVDKYLEEKKMNEDSKQHVVDSDISISTSNFVRGALSPITLVIKDILSYFQSLNFTIQSGEEVMESKYNFDNLNIPDTHPTREPSETFYSAKKGISLRTQNTASSAQFIENNKDDEIRIANFGYVYRNDDDDQTHSHQFNQVDFIWVKKGLNAKNLKWVINGLVKKLYGQQTKTRYRLSNFPFTEPSFEVDATCPFCQGKGCTRCKGSGWIELLGSGIMREEVLKSAHIAGKNAIAFGIGIERVAMIKYGIHDIRDIYNNDFRFLKQFINEDIKA